MCIQGKQLETAGASGLLSVSLQPADPSTTQAAQRAKHTLSTSKVRAACVCLADTLSHLTRASVYVSKTCL